jgi:hypothetical protein
MGRHTKMMLTLGDGLGFAEGVDTLVGDGKTVGVEDGTGVAHPASRAQTTTAANVFIVR